MLPDLSEWSVPRLKDRRRNDKLVVTGNLCKWTHSVDGDRDQRGIVNFGEALAMAASPSYSTE